MSTLRPQPYNTIYPELHIEENPQLDCVAEAANLAALRARAVAVYTDCPGQ
jgi:hypothetical protein